MDEDGYINFEWDAVKASTNERKHGVTFREAATVFSDPYARVIDDPDHSGQEQRFVIIGMSMGARTLTVCHCLRDEGTGIRSISARKATHTEEHQYWRYRHEE